MVSCLTGDYESVVALPTDRYGDPRDVIDANLCRITGQVRERKIAEVLSGMRTHYRQQYLRWTNQHTATGPLSRSRLRSNNQR